MKKKMIVTSALTAALMLAGAVGGTFAWFTNEAKTDVNITAGKVSIESTVSDLKTYSLGVEQAAGKFENGGVATLEEQTITLDKMTPGDKVTFKVTVKNNSDVKIQYRVVFQKSGDLGPALVGDATGGASIWTPLEVGSQDIDLSASIELPETVGNEYQGKAGQVKIVVEATQFNAPLYDKWDGVSYPALAQRGWMTYEGNKRYYVGKLGSTANSTSKPAASQEAYDAALAAAQVVIDELENSEIGITLSDVGDRYGIVHVTNPSGLAYLNRLNDYISAKNFVTYDTTNSLFSDYYYYGINAWDIEVETDADLNNQEWAPISGITAKDVDFNNHVITNLKVTDQAAAGLFGNVRLSGSLMNIVVTNAEVACPASLDNSTSAGVVAGSFAGKSIENATVINGIAKNAKFNGVIGGYCYGSVNNCVATDSKSIGSYKCGGVLGYICSEPARDLEVNGNVLTNVEVDVPVLLAGKSVKVMGKVVGNYNSNGSCLNNTCTNVYNPDVADLPLIGEVEAGRTVQQ